MKITTKAIIFILIWVTVWTGVYYYNQHKLILNGLQFEKEAMALDIDKIYRDNKRMKILAYKPIQDHEWPEELEQKASIMNIYRKTRR